MKRLSYIVLLIAASWLLVPPSNATVKTPIIPMRAKAEFSAGSAHQWSAPIKSTDGRTAYILSLEPERDAQHHVLSVELVLRRSGQKADSRNLLAPSGMWHGLQAYDFAANDLVQGAQKSAFGEKRMIPLKDLGLMLQIEVSDAKVSPILADQHQLDVLCLEIEVGATTGLASSAGQQDDEKSNLIDNSLCNYAKVYHLKHGSHLSVRSGAGLRFAKVGSLSEGTFVYICDERGDWVEVFYGGDTPCGSEISTGIRQNETSGCKSGWVNRKWIDVLSG